MTHSIIILAKTETATLEAQLKQFTAFSELEPDLLHWLASNVRLFQAPVGQELLARDIPPEYCFGILDGRARLLHHDPGVRRPLTLALCQPGDLVGWAGLVRHRPCEWLTAAGPLKLIGFTAETFYSLERDSAAFRSWLDASSSPSEFIDVIQPALRDRPHAEPDEREVLRRLLKAECLLILIVIIVRLNLTTHQFGYGMPCRLISMI